MQLQITLAKVFEWSCFLTLACIRSNYFTQFHWYRASSAHSKFFSTPFKIYDMRYGEHGSGARLESKDQTSVLQIQEESGPSEPL